MRFAIAGIAVLLTWAAWATPAQAQYRSRTGAGQGGGRIPQIRVENRLTMIELEGKFAGGTGGGPSPTISMKGDTDLDDELWQYDLKVALGDVRAGWLEFGLFRFASRGKRILHHPVQFRGVNFPAGTLTKSRLDFRWSELVLGQLYGYGGGYYIGYEVGAANYRYRVRIRAPLDGLYMRVDEEPGLPLVGVKLAVGLGSALLFAGTIRGNFFSFGSLDSNVLEAEIDLRIQTGSWLLFHVGWQYFRLDAKFNLSGADTAWTDFYVQGPYLGIEIRIG